MTDMTTKRDPKNLVSQPPLTTPLLDQTGRASRAWAIWFRDLYVRTAYKGGNAIDNNIETLDEVIAQVLINIENIADNKSAIEVNAENIEQNKLDIIANTEAIIQNALAIAENSDDIADNAAAIAQNVINIAVNAQNILNLEFRVFGGSRPSPYSQTSGYLSGDFIVNPSNDPQSYYRAIDDIPAPAGSFNPTLWKKVSLIDNDAYIELTRDQAKAAFVAAGYGGIGVDAVKAIGTINSTFQTLEGFDTDLIATPLDVTYDKANHGVELDRQGIWEFTLKITLTFDEVNAGRQIQFRSYNATTATPGGTVFNYFVGRNQAGVNIPLTIAIDLPPANVGDLIQLQVGSASDTFTNSSNIGTIYQVKHISERKEDLGA